MDPEAMMAQSLETGIKVETTLAIIKPDAVHNAEEIKNVILKSGFTVLQKRILQLNLDECLSFYADQEGKDFFNDLTLYMSSGPILVFALARGDAIAHWKSIMGPANITEARETLPECLRAKYGTSDLKNAVHGSNSFTAAAREIKFMFPNSVIEPLSIEESEKYLKEYVNPTLLRGLTELCKQKPLNPCMWLADWLSNQVPNTPTYKSESL